MSKGKFERQCQNHAETAIKYIKDMSTRILDKSGVPSRYETFYVLYDTQVANYSATQSLNWRTPCRQVFSNTLNVHVNWGLDFYQMINYQTKIPENKAKIIEKCP